MAVQIRADKYETDIPFSATFTKYYYDGTKSKQITSGTYKGQNVQNVRVEYGEITPLDSRLTSGRRRRSANSCEHDPDQTLLNQEWFEYKL